MKTLTLKLPAMFGDHHVVEVRRLLTELPDIGEIYASSAFRTVEVQYDDTKVTPTEVEKVLEEAGYLEELPVPVEIGATSPGTNGDRAFFRHTTAYQQVGSSVSFAQKIPYAGKPLWPCPGFGVIEHKEEVEHG
jgi:copper chaperone CopZ